VALVVGSLVTGVEMVARAHDSLALKFTDVFSSYPLLPNS
jgi:hypothetical protein